MPSIDRNIFMSEKFRNIVYGNRIRNQIIMKRNLNSDGQQFYNYQQNKHGCFILMTVQSIPLICIQQMSKHIIHLYGVFNNMINEIPTRGDNTG